jgi:hypothetical protein
VNRLMENARDIFAPLFRDLLHLEITLMSHPITDRTAAPDPVDQLEDIQKCYQTGMRPLAPLVQEMDVLDFQGADPDALESLAPTSSPAAVGESPVDLRASFSLLADAADAGVTSVETIRSDPQSAHAESVLGALGAVESADPDPSALDDQEQIMLRIRENSRQICRILDEANYQPVPDTAVESLSAAPARKGSTIQFTPEHVMQIRKFWEVRPQDGIFLRTVIGMDGDVIVHVDPRIGGPEFVYLHKLHEQSVKTSVDFWKELVGILTDFVSKAVNAAFFR